MTATPDRAASPSRSGGVTRPIPAAPYEGDGAAGTTPVTAAARGAAVAGTARGSSAPGNPTHLVPLLQAEGPRPKRGRRPKDIGTAAETAVVRWLQANGFPHAERRALRGTADAGDITGTPGICWEVKARSRPVSDEQITAWLAETDQEMRHAGGDVGVLVIRRPGVGPANAGRWWAVVESWVIASLTVGTDGIVHMHPDTPTPPVRMLLADAVALLRWAGYGEPEVQP